MKKLTKAVLAAVFCLAVGYTAYNSQKDQLVLANALLSNVEALASESSGSGCIRCRADVYWDCILVNGGFYVGYCPYMRGF